MARIIYSVFLVLLAAGCEHIGRPVEVDPGITARGGSALQADPTVEFQYPADQFSTSNGEIGVVAAVNHGERVRKVTLEVNNAPIKALDLPRGGARIPLEAPAPLALGLNRITVTAETDQGRRFSASVAVNRMEAEAAPPAGEIGRRWAVVVGISAYRHSARGIPPLKFAHRDAEAFMEFLQSPGGGGFRPENCKLLLDDQATTLNLRTALFTFLKAAAKDDLVIIFFAGHGAPEPGRPDNLYLITHDTDPEALAATAFPMWDMETALKRYILAERVVILADACHSGGIGLGEGLRSGGSNLIHTYLASLQKTSPGRAIITASEANQLSRESEKWGGHGVFTHFLLEGLKGKADQDGDGVVTISEAFGYVYDQVRRATDSQQHPGLQGRFDRNLPLGVTGERRGGG